MADTLINVNQNQLNTQNGSFTELIKSTQQGKEKLATALVNKGANVSSSSTLSDLAIATNNLQTLDGITPVIGNTVGHIYWTNSNPGAGYFVTNEKGNFWFVQVSNDTTIRIYNISESCYNENSTTAVIKQITDLQASSYYYQGSTCFYINEDGTILIYVGSDKQSIYKYTVDYTNVTDLDPINVTMTLSNTYSLPSTLPNQYNTIVAYNEDTDDIIIRSSGGNSASPSGSSSNPYYKFNLTNSSLTTLTTDNVLQPNAYDRTYTVVNLSKNKLLYIGYFGRYVYTIDYSNNTITQSEPINMGPSPITEASGALQYARVKLTPTKSVVAFIAPAFMGTMTNLYSTLILIDVNTGKPEYYNSDNYVMVPFSEFSNRFTVPSIPTKVGDAFYFAGGYVGEYWKLHITDYNTNTYTVTSAPLLMCGDTSPNWASYKTALCTYKPSTNGVIVFQNYTSRTDVTYRQLLSNQLIAYKYKVNNQETVFTPTRWYYTQCRNSGALDLPQVDVLVEDN